QRLARAGERAAEEVEQAVAGHLERVGGNLRAADTPYGADQRQGGARAHRARLRRIVSLTSSRRAARSTEPESTSHCMATPRSSARYMAASVPGSASGRIWPSAFPRRLHAVSAARKDSFIWAKS